MNVILRGKVTMEDGSAPPKSVGLEKVCTDRNGNAPGPITNRKGEYTWRMDVNPMSPRRCILKANLKDYMSSEVDITGISGFIDINVNLPDIVLSPEVPDPMSLNLSDQGVPGAARDPWKKASEAVMAGDLNAAQAQYKLVSEKAPKFARGWVNLGILQASKNQPAEALTSFQQAVANDPKDVMAHVLLARMQVQIRDWAGAAKTAADGIAADKKRTYAELFVHHAVALYEQKDVAGAETSARAAFDPKASLKAVRGELVLAKIYEAKGDLAKAKEHAAHYLQAAPRVRDKDMIQAYIDKLGQPDAPQLDLDLF